MPWLSVLQFGNIITTPKDPWTDRFRPWSSGMLVGAWSTAVGGACSSVVGGGGVRTETTACEGGLGGCVGGAGEGVRGGGGSGATVSPGL